MIGADGRLRARLIRAARPYYAHAPASGEGARRFGGRFNAVGAPALYLSFALETAANEVRFTLNHQPFTFYFLDVDAGPVADLSDSAVRDSLGVACADLESPNWESDLHRGVEPASHRVSRELMAAGFAGAITPSFAPGARRQDRNLVLWRWEEVATNSDLDGAGSKVFLVNRQALPVDQASWPNR